MESLWEASSSSTTSLTWETPSRGEVINIFKEKKTITSIIGIIYTVRQTFTGGAKQYKIFQTFEKLINYEHWEDEFCNWPPLKNQLLLILWIWWNFGPRGFVPYFPTIGTFWCDCSDINKFSDLLTKYSQHIEMWYQYL